MKKIIAFAITALLIGGFAFNANAQSADKAPQKAKTEQVQKGQNYDQMLKDFETNINKYIENYEKALKGGSDSKVDYKTYLKKAQDLQSKLEKAKDKLNDSQIEMFLKLKDKLANALKRKG